MLKGLRVTSTPPGHPKTIRFFCVEHTHSIGSVTAPPYVVLAIFWAHYRSHSPRGGNRRRSKVFILLVAAILDHQSTGFCLVTTDWSCARLRRAQCRRNLHLSLDFLRRRNSPHFKLRATIHETKVTVFDGRCGIISMSDRQRRARSSAG